MRVPASAKLNRFLAVLGRRPDGFHELELVTTVLEDVPGLTDTLEGEPAAALSLALSGPMSEGLAVDESNLVLRAWRLLEREARRPLPAALRLEKRIPHGAGLGGGSSDAAAALKLGNELCGLGLAQADLLRLAAELGSDVPLFVLGGTVLGLGRGVRRMESLLLACQGLRIQGSAALELCRIAAGELDLYAGDGTRPWDVAAGLVILEEAGGRATTWTGQELDMSDPRFPLATNGALHAAALRVAQDFLL